MRLWLAVAAALALAGGARAQDAMSAVRAVPWAPADVIALAGQAADWQLAHIADVPPTAWGSESVKPQSWEQGALFTGLAALADRDPAYVAPVLARGVANGWQPGPRPYHADDYAIAAAYLWDSRHGAGDAAIAPTRARLDAILAAKPANSLDFADPHCQDRWCWCDALFMAPPVWFEMTRLTGDPKYAAYAKAEIFATVDALYDRDRHLFYRDSRFLTRRDINGQPLFWSRGNGWVFAGLARILPLLDDADPDKARLVALFRDMAAELKSIQKPDGYWAPSLLGDANTALPEASGTGFYVYGLAWGVKAGLLDRAVYEPAVRSGWAALARAVHDDGQVGYVQPVSDRPDTVTYDGWQFYGTGAFLLAATAVADLDLAPVRPLDVTAIVDNPSDYDQPAVYLTAYLGPLDGVAAYGGWSVEKDGRTYPAQENDGEMAFVVPMKAHEKSTLRFIPQAAAVPLRVLATLDVQDGGTLQDGVVAGGAFHLRSAYAVPADHTGHDGLIAFEGVGWESDKAAYRLYLDGRNVVDIYGKKLPDPILPAIGQNVGDYHSMNAWGQDILQVDQSLGMGGVGVLRDGRATQIGPSAITAAVANEGPVTARAEVTSAGFDGGKASLAVQYHAYAGLPLTWVTAQADGDVPVMVAGLVHHRDVEVLSSPGKGPDGTGYVATWGRQSLAGDDLGMVLFFQKRGVTGGVGDDGQTLYVTFRDPKLFNYAFAALWPQDGSGVKTRADFEHWLAVMVDAFDHPATVTIDRGTPEQASRP